MFSWLVAATAGQSRLAQVRSGGWADPTQRPHDFGIAGLTEQLD
jgi:hypothetical protein